MLRCAEALGNMPWEDILKVLETGSMRAQGAQLPPEDRIAVARYLGKAGAPVALPKMTGVLPERFETEGLEIRLERMEFR